MKPKLDFTGLNKSARDAQPDDGKLVTALKQTGPVLVSVVRAYDLLNKIEAAFGGAHTILARIGGGAPVAQVAAKTKPATAAQRQTDAIAIAALTNTLPPGTKTAQPAQAKKNVVTPTSKLTALVNEAPTSKESFWKQHRAISDSGNPNAAYYASIYWRAHARREWMR